MVATEVLIAICVLALGYLILQWYKDPLRKVPGPPGLPFLGNLLELQPATMHMGLYELSQRYGPVMKIHLFTQPYVILNTAEVCIEALIKRGTDFQGRPPLFRIQSLTQTDVAFSSYDHPLYSPLRKLATKALRAYGVGISQLEKIMQETMMETVDLLTSEHGHAVDAHDVNHGFTSCVMASVLFGEKYSYDDPICSGIDRLNQRIVTAADLLSAGSTMDIYPILSKFSWLFPSGARELKETQRQCEEFFSNRIKEAKVTYDKSHLRGCLDYFIQQQNEQLNADGSRIFSDECLRGLFVDFIVGGIETSTALLDQAILELVANISLQKNLQHEIDTVIGHTEIPNLSHRDRMPQLESFVHECLRYLTQAPLLLPHYTIRDTEVGGYKIPAHTRVFINSFSAAHDREVYADPFDFKAERFIGDDGNILPPDHPIRSSFVGFGLGRRQCPGEYFARTRIQLFLATILQRFDLVADGHVPEKDIRKHQMRIVISPPHSMVKFNPRSF